jgi:glycosyltransferase involved in cell wall biosynthesis
MRYSVIIPAWNEEAFLPQTLTAITAVMRCLNDKGAHQGELIVVDNNSSDATADIAKQFGALVAFEPINQIARARNRGAEIATGDSLIFLDADTCCSEKLLAHVLEKLSSGMVVGGGSTIVADREVPAMAMRGIQFWNWLGCKAKLAAGCFVYCRRDAFDAVGGFSDRVYAGEEIFLSRLLKRWAKQNNMTFDIVSIDPVVTSARKLEWYSPMQLARQVLLMLIPGAVFSKKLCRTWYDSSANRE